MSQISVFDMTGKKVADTELNDAIFGIEPLRYRTDQAYPCP